MHSNGPHRQVQVLVSEVKHTLLRHAFAMIEHLHFEAQG
jgi:hypothetical protein